jgi:hypothetical protein
VIFIPEPCEQAKAAIGTPVTAIDDGRLSIRYKRRRRAAQPRILHEFREVLPPPIFPFS